MPAAGGLSRLRPSMRQSRLWALGTRVDASLDLEPLAALPRLNRERSAAKVHHRLKRRPRPRAGRWGLCSDWPGRPDSGLAPPGDAGGMRRG
jgi:hypothetical protein